MFKKSNFSDKVFKLTTPTTLHITCQLKENIAPFIYVENVQNIDDLSQQYFNIIDQFREYSGFQGATTCPWNQPVAKLKENNTKAYDGKFLTLIDDLKGEDVHMELIVKEVWKFTEVCGLTYKVNRIDRI